MLSVTRHRQVITRPEFMGRVVHTSLVGLSNTERRFLWRMKMAEHSYNAWAIRRETKLSHRATPGHRQIITPERVRFLHVLVSFLGGGAFLAVMFAAVYFWEI